MAGNARKASLREAIKAYRERAQKLDRRGRDLLVRLAGDADAVKVFERLKLKDQRAEACIITACIAADNVAHSFPRLVLKQKDALVRAKQWEQAVTTLRRFVAEVTEQQEPLRVGLPFDLWSLRILEAPAENEELQQALDLIESFIEWRRGIVQANKAHIGVTRDAQIKQGAENAAIWILAAGVYDAARDPPLPGKPHYTEVADLAEVILRTDITKDRVREVVRKRRQLYLNMSSDQAQRFFRNKGAEARRASRSTYLTGGLASKKNA